MLGFLVVRTSATPVLPVLFIAGLLSGGGPRLPLSRARRPRDRPTPGDRRAAVVGIFSAMFLVGQTTGAFAFG